MSWRGLIEEFRDRLPVDASTPVVTLLEGNTPLIPADHVSELVDRAVYLKYDGANPTGSFKDRGMTMALSQAVADGAKAVICASTGNTSASAAALSMPGTVTAIATAMLNAPGFPLIGPMDTSALIETSAGSLVFCMPATAFIAPMKQAE